MNWKDSIVRTLALHWVKGKIDGLRKAGSPVAKFLDGNKNRIIGLVYLVASFVAMFQHGADYTEIANGLLKALGYNQDAGVAASMAVVATQLFALWGVIDSIIKAYKQSRAGASLSEINSTVGVVKQALAAGQIVDGRSGTVMADTAAPARAVPSSIPVKADVVVVAPAADVKG